MPPAPLRFSQLFDVALNATVKRFWTLAGLVLVAAVPARAVEVAILAVTISNPNDITSRSNFGSGTGAPTNGAAAVNVTVGLLGAVVTVVGTALCFKVAAAAYAGSRTDGRSSLAFAAPRLGLVLWAAIIGGLGVVGGFLALIVPGVFLLVAWSLFVPALLFEDLSPTRALGRSFELVRGHWWATCGALLVAALIAGVASGLVSSAFDALMKTGLGDHVLTAALVDGVGGTVASAVALPIQAVMIAVLYFDRRSRIEQLDADVVARRLGIETPASTVPGTAAPPSPEEEFGDWTPPEPPEAADPPREWLPPRPPGPDDN
ncbi:MAG: hypothetical protein ACJ77M_13020 [Thermoleophilaceae bacterium]